MAGSWLGPGWSPFLDRQLPLHALPEIVVLGGIRLFCDERVKKVGGVFQTETHNLKMFSF